MRDVGYNGVFGGYCGSGVYCCGSIAGPRRREVGAGGGLAWKDTSAVEPYPRRRGSLGERHAKKGRPVLLQLPRHHETRGMPGLPRHSTPPQREGGRTQDRELGGGVDALLVGGGDVVAFARVRAAGGFCGKLGRGRSAARYPCLARRRGLPSTNLVLVSTVGARGCIATEQQR